MKTLWIFNHYAQAPGGPGGTRHFSLAHNLLREGWATWIIAASTEHGTGRQRLEERERVRVENFGGVRFVWIRVPEYSGNGLGRIRNMAAYAVHAAGQGWIEEVAAPDAVIGSSVHPLAGVAASRQARQYGVPFIFEVRDLWPETLIAFGRISRHGLPAILLRSLEKRLYRRAATIVSVLPKASDYIAGCGVEAAKVVWIPNGVDSDRFDSALPSQRNETFTFMYLGAHGQANSLETLIEAVGLLESGEIPGKLRVRLVGTGPEKDRLRAMARALGLASVSFESPVPAQQIPEIASTADGFVICARQMPELYKYGISMNKLYDYMAAARPVVAALGAVNNPIDEAGCGLTVPPGDPRALAKALSEVSALPPERHRAMGLAGRRHVEEHYDYRILSGRLARLLDSLKEEDVPALR